MTTTARQIRLRPSHTRTVSRCAGIICSGITAPRPGFSIFPAAWRSSVRSSSAYEGSPAGIAEWCTAGSVNEPIEPKDGRPDGLRTAVFLEMFGPDYLDLAHRTRHARAGCAPHGAAQPP